MTYLEPAATKPALYWCIGLYASGSTWLFNAGKKIAAACGLQSGLVSSFITNQAEFVFPPGAQTAIVKTHATDDATAQILAVQSQTIWLSLRDPRDCMTSLMLYQNYPFDEALDVITDAVRSCVAVLIHPRMRPFRFEDNFFENPETLDVIAASFGRRLAAGDRDRIYTETRRSAIEAFISRFHEAPTAAVQPEPGHFVDLDTQWHTHHIGRDGVVGRWRRMLTVEQVTAIETRLGNSMARLGYRTGVGN